MGGAVTAVEVGYLFEHLIASPDRKLVIHNRGGAGQIHRQDLGLGAGDTDLIPIHIRVVTDQPCIGQIPGRIGRIIVAGFGVIRQIGELQLHAIGRALIQPLGVGRHYGDEIFPIFDPELILVGAFANGIIVGCHGLHG